MKWFWILILALAVTTGILLARREKPAAVALDSLSEIAPLPAAETPAVNEPPEPEVADASPGDVQSVSSSVERPADPPAAVPSPDQPIAAGTPEEVVVEVTPPAAVERARESTSAEVAVTEAPPPPVETPAAPDATPPEVKPSADSVPADEAPAAAPVMFRDQFEVVPARMKPGENGFTIYDERFPVKGSGTEEDPIEVSWDLLVSASETFQPRMGKKRLPERIAMLDKKHVRITGYIAFPIMAAAQNEMLTMRNMWDGCCIGVPPTPYDAVEVKLKAAATGRDRFTAFGTVEGVMQVDPYIKGNWLLGLYLMEGATLSQLKEGGDPGKHGGM